jgi:hypothetical protein
LRNYFKDIDKKSFKISALKRTPQNMVRVNDGLGEVWLKW